jgi:hypothetical protein
MNTSRKTKKHISAIPKRLLFHFGILPFIAGFFVYLLPSAQAATRLDACGGGACGSATFTFRSETLVDSISMSVKDTACNARAAYIQFEVWAINGDVSYTQRRYNNNGCRAGYKSWSGLKIVATRGIPIAGLKVLTCVDGRFCNVSKYVRNPCTLTAC